MVKRSYYIINGITLYRLLAAPFLIFLVFTREHELFKWMLGISFFTDAIDGYLARRFKVTSVLGAKLDSIGDDLTVLVAVIGIIVFRPEFMRQEMWFFIILLALFIVQVILAYIRYGKMTNFHTYAAKISAVMQGVFLLLFFFLDQPLYPLFYLAVGFTAIDLVEEIIIVGMLPNWEVNVKGIYWILKRKKSKVKK